MIILLLWSVIAAIEYYPYKRVTLEDRAPNARCLDGSPAIYYFSPGFGDGVDKFYIHHEGGAWCTSVADCANRAKWNGVGGLGGIGQDPEIISDPGCCWSGLFVEYFKRNKKSNPIFYNWNYAFLRYCDGYSFSGKVDDPVQYLDPTTNKTTLIYMRGHVILKAIISSLVEEKGVDKANEVVVGGCSAGGLATYINCDFWAHSLSKYPTRVTCMADSGFFELYDGLDDYWLHAFRNGVEAQNATGSFSTGCLEEFKEEPWRCTIAQNLAPYIRTPLFALQSKYDSYQIGAILCGYNTKCMTDAELVNEWGKNLTERIKGKLLQNPQHGVFLDSCFHHCNWNGVPWNGILISAGDGLPKITAAQAFAIWYNRTNTDKLDSASEHISVEIATSGRLPRTGDGSTNALYVWEQARDYRKVGNWIWDQNASFPCSSDGCAGMKPPATVEEVKALRDMHLLK
jgi:hypothetical protein